MEYTSQVTLDGARASVYFPHGLRTTDGGQGALGFGGFDKSPQIKRCRYGQLMSQKQWVWGECEGHWWHLKLALQESKSISLGWGSTSSQHSWGKMVVGGPGSVISPLRLELSPVPWIESILPSLLPSLILSFFSPTSHLWCWGSICTLYTGYASVLLLSCVLSQVPVYLWGPQHLHLSVPQEYRG